MIYFYLEMNISFPFSNEALLYNLMKQQQSALDPKYKRELCNKFMIEGTCNYGIKCRFAHGYNDVILPPNNSARFRCMPSKPCGSEQVQIKKYARLPVFASLEQDCYENGSTGSSSPDSSIIMELKDKSVSNIPTTQAVQATEDAPPRISKLSMLLNGINETKKKIKS